jgi:deazaflavin-dependent oxidoreductase (nitroreductase family)
VLVLVVDGDRVVLVASNGGDDRDPDWYLNLVAHPEVDLTRRNSGDLCAPSG